MRRINNDANHGDMGEMSAAINPTIVMGVTAGAANKFALLGIFFYTAFNFNWKLGYEFSSLPIPHSLMQDRKSTRLNSSHRL